LGDRSVTSNKSSARLSRSFVSEVTAKALSRIRLTTSKATSGLVAGGMASAATVVPVWLAVADANAAAQIANIAT
jgi:hypothetical protein